MIASRRASASWISDLPALTRPAYFFFLGVVVVGVVVVVVGVVVVVVGVVVVDVVLDVAVVDVFGAV